MKSVSFGIAVLFCSMVFSYTMCRVSNIVFQFSDAVLIGVGFRVGNCMKFVSREFKNSERNVAFRVGYTNLTWKMQL